MNSFAPIRSRLSCHDVVRALFVVGAILGVSPSAGAQTPDLRYLRTLAMRATTDTLDTFDSPRGSGPITRGNGSYVVRTLKPASDRRWELVDTWYDSTSKVTARQSMRTARGSLAIELETVRANGDSASMLFTPDRVTGWVVQQGRAPRLVDAVNTTDRFSDEIVAMAIAKSHPAIGAVFVAPRHVLYGANPVETTIDSVRVVRRDTLFRGAVPIPVLVLSRGSGEVWVDVTTGAELLSRGNAGPQRWWWHIRRGVRAPAVTP